VITSGSAKQTYMEYCAVCHGRDGYGTKHAKGFRGKQLDREYIKKMIQSGNTVMPKFHFINGKTVDELADYVHNLK
jgi:mono/diheme cytochrome c family protein